MLIRATVIGNNLGAYIHLRRFETDFYKIEKLKNFQNAFRTNNDKIQNLLTIFSVSEWLLLHFSENFFFFHQKFNEEQLFINACSTECLFKNKNDLTKERKKR